jgi:hypothetical protein
MSFYYIYEMSNHMLVDMSSATSPFALSSTIHLLGLSCGSTSLGLLLHDFIFLYSYF